MTPITFMNSTYLILAEFLLSLAAAPVRAGWNKRGEEEGSGVRGDYNHGTHTYIIMSKAHVEIGDCGSLSTLKN